MTSATRSLPLQPGATASAPSPSGLQRWLAAAAGAVWRAFQEMGRARARRELLEYAERCEAYQPELAKELRAAAGHDPL
jgi:hypothetical protein